MKGYLWMTDYTPQREWIEGQGILLWLAFFFTEIGAGLYLVSLYLGFTAGALAGWLICALLGGGLHMAYLGKPLRAWRSMLRPRSSELSRGIIIMSLFLFVGALQLASALEIPGLPWNGGEIFFKIFQSVLGFFVITHGFMTLSVIQGIPFWNSAVMPVLSLASGIWVGAQAMTGLALVMGAEGLVIRVEPVIRWFLFSYVLLAAFYLWNSAHGLPAAKKSLQVLLRGELSPLFYIGVVVVSFLVPTALTLWIAALGDSITAAWLIPRLSCAVVGDLAFRYCVFRAARYTPLINTNIARGLRSA